MVMGFPGAKMLEITLPKTNSSPPKMNGWKTFPKTSNSSSPKMKGWKTILSFWGKFGLFLKVVCC